MEVESLLVTRRHCHPVLKWGYYLKRSPSPDYIIFSFPFGFIGLLLCWTQFDLLGFPCALSISQLLSGIVPFSL